MSNVVKGSIDIVRHDCWPKQVSVDISRVRQPFLGKWEYPEEGIFWGYMWSGSHLVVSEGVELGADCVELLATNFSRVFAT